MHTNKNRGFTIVELLIVIVVIGILALIVISSFRQIQRNSRNQSRIQYVKTIEKALYSARLQAGPVPNFWGVDTSACIGEGMIDANSDSTPDCYYEGTTVYRSSIPVVTTWMRNGSSISGAYPLLYIGPNSNSAPFLVYDASVIDGVASDLSLRYFLEGEGLNCGLKTAASTGGNTYTMTNPANNSGSFSGVTACVVPLIKLERL
ncbi:type II secretion system protein [Candidatus Saccharibacteria bacterium]|nr:type II secretion system protein [Candidatus Saccharibacteria bacterium]